MMNKNRLLNALLLVVSVCIGEISFAQTSASFTNTTECDGNSTSFTSTSSTTVGSIIRKSWDFDGDSVWDASGTSVNYKFDNAGTYTVMHQVETDSGFIATVKNSVTVYPSPSIDFNFSGICLGESTEFNATASITNGFIQGYDWEFNGDGKFDDASGQNVNFSFITTGYFYVGGRVESDKGCFTDTFKVVSIAPVPAVNFTVNDACEGKEIQTSNASILSGTSVDYSWNFGDGNTNNQFEPSHLYSTSGDFEIKLKGETPYGCSDSLSKMVSVFPSPSASYTASSVCEGNETEFSNLSSMNGGNIASSFWDFGNGMSRFDMNSSQTLTYNESGMYNTLLIVNTDEGCSDTAEVQVEVYPNPVAKITANGPTEFCDGGSVELSTDIDSTQNIAWSTGASESSITVEENGNYEIVVINSNGCFDRDSTRVYVNFPPTLKTSNDTTIENGDYLAIWADGSKFYSWGNLDDDSYIFSEKPMVRPSEKTTYSVTATDENGCISDAEVTVNVESNFNLNPTNLITPDGNGQNDIWYIDNIDRYPSCTVMIYNSSGKLLYEQKNYSNDWDGTLDGNQLPEGTYYYIISCDGLDKKFNGAINLLRVN